MSSRRDELLAKKAKLAELKRQRELREEQRSTGGRQSIGGQVRKEYPQPWFNLTVI
jgi:dynein intermediate chain, cytosolic